jgi:hypothetical protein
MRVVVTGQAELEKALTATVKTKRDKAILWATKWARRISTSAKDRLVWHNLGSAEGGRASGILRRSISYDLIPEEKSVLGIAGISRNSPAINYAKFVEGPPAIGSIPRRHFLSFARNPMFLRWARSHGVKVKTTKTGKFSPGGLMVGGRCFPFMAPAYEANKDAALKDAQKTLLEMK